MSKQSLTIETLSKYPNKNFVETGTFKGGSVLTALSCGFDSVYSVELHKPYFDYCVALYKDEPRVVLYNGDSALLLWDMIKDIKEPITFWLDGHIERNLPFGIKPIPIMEELLAIGKHPIKNHTILIDDRRVMGTDVWFGLTEQEVIKGLMKINKDYVISYEDSCNGPNDIVVARLK